MSLVRQLDMSKEQLLDHIVMLERELQTQKDKESELKILKKQHLELKDRFKQMYEKK